MPESFDPAWEYFVGSEEAEEDVQFNTFDPRQENAGVSYRRVTQRACPSCGRDFVGPNRHCTRNCARSIARLNRYLRQTGQPAVDMGAELADVIAGAKESAA